LPQTPFFLFVTGRLDSLRRQPVPFGFFVALLRRGGAADGRTRPHQLVMSFAMESAVRPAARLSVRSRPISSVHWRAARSRRWSRATGRRDSLWRTRRLFLPGQLVTSGLR
jgi:hypothetical protein